MPILSIELFQLQFFLAIINCSILDKGSKMRSLFHEPNPTSAMNPAKRQMIIGIENRACRLGRLIANIWSLKRVNLWDMDTFFQHDTAPLV